MTGNVTSLTRMRSAARRRSETVRSNSRTSTALLVVVAILVVIGLSATMSASSTVAIAEDSDRFYYLKSQLVGVGLGTLSLVVMSRIPYGTLRRFALPGFVVTIGLLVAVLVIGYDGGGARRWIGLGPLTFQPSEVAKLATIVMLATLMERKGNQITTFGHYLAPVAFSVGVVAGLVMLEPDLGTTIVIGAASLAVIMASSTPFHYVAATGVAGTTAAGILAFSAGYRSDRITGFLDPWSNASAEGYQLIQGYYALSNGGYFGVGLGASRARWFYLPNAHTDFIFAIIGEETGFLGAILVIALFTVLAIVGWVTAVRASDIFGRMLAIGITSWITFQALANIGGVLGAIPITGIALPFVSYGGTALVTSMAALGILVNIARHGGHSSRRAR